VVRLSLRRKSRGLDPRDQGNGSIWTITHHAPSRTVYDSAEWTYLRLMRTARANFRIQPYWTVRQNSIECCLRRMMVC
jgi:hypothetical protein